MAKKKWHKKTRIDFWLIDSNIRPSIYKTDIRPAQIKHTDHLAVSLKIINTSIRGPNFWKMNNAYLKDKNYINLINETIDNCLSELSNNATSHQTLWHYCKVLIKEKSINYAKIKSKERKNLLFSLETE